MVRRIWRFYAVIGAASCTISTLLGPSYSYWNLGAIASATFVASIFGPAVWRSKSRAVWIVSGFGSLVILASVISQAPTFPYAHEFANGIRIADFLNALALFIEVCAAIALARLRDATTGPKNVIDSSILALGVAGALWTKSVLPYLREPGLVAVAASLKIITSLLALALVFSVSRITLATGKKEFAFVPLSMSVVFAIISHVISIDQSDALSSVSVLAGSYALVCLGIALLHPSIAHVSEQHVGMPSMSRLRVVMMMAAVISAPILILESILRSPDHAAEVLGLIGILIAMMVLVVLRLTDLVYANERIARMERIRRTTVGSMTVLHGVDAIARTAIRAIAETVSVGAFSERASLLVKTDESWKVIASEGIWSSAAIGNFITDEKLVPLFGFNDNVVRAERYPIDIDAAREAHVCIVRFGVSDRSMVAIAVTSDRPLQAEMVEALSALASDVSLVLESAELKTVLHSQESESRFHVLVRNSTDITFVIDQAGTVTYVTPSVTALLGFEIADLMGRSFNAFVHPADMNRAMRSFGLLINGREVKLSTELRVVTKDDSWKTMEFTLSDLREEASIGGIVVNAHDITERKALEEDLRHHVLHDPLTGMPNRILFAERVTHALSTRRTEASQVVVMTLDIDDFKLINDALGQDAGNEALRVLGFRLDSYVRSGDTAARFNGDVFAVLLENIGAPDDMAVAARRLLEVVHEPMRFGDRDFRFTASIGVAISDTTTTADDLLRSADMALHQAKNAGKNTCRVFDATMREHVSEHMEVREGLEHALERKEMTVAYQPLLSIASGELVGFEALLRWNRANRSPVGPNLFIPIAEETGLIVPIGRWVMNAAMQQLAAWKAYAKHNELVMSINASPVQMLQSNFVDDVQQALNASGLMPSDVVLEITESESTDHNEIRSTIHRLRDLGVGLAVDDFGTGFASYASIQQLPFTSIKIDRSIINGLAEDQQRARAQVHSIIEMAHAMGASVTAEGIETKSQLDSLTELQADKAQGFFFSRPLPVDEATDWVIGKRHARELIHTD